MNENAKVLATVGTLTVTDLEVEEFLLSLGQRGQMYAAYQVSHRRNTLPCRQKLLPFRRQACPTKARQRLVPCVWQAPLSAPRGR